MSSLRTTICDALIVPSDTKYQSSGPCNFRVKKIFKNCILTTYFMIRDLLIQPTGTVKTTLVEDHLGIIPVKFSQNPMNGFRGEVV